MASFLYHSLPLCIDFYFFIFSNGPPGLHFAGVRAELGKPKMSLGGRVKTEVTQPLGELAWFSKKKRVKEKKLPGSAQWSQAKRPATPGWKFFSSGPPGFRSVRVAPREASPKMSSAVG